MSGLQNNEETPASANADDEDEDDDEMMTIPQVVVARRIPKKLQQASRVQAIAVVHPGQRYMMMTTRMRMMMISLQWNGIPTFSLVCTKVSNNRK